MAGIAWLAAFEVCGLAIARRLFDRCGRLARAWLGLSLGLMMAMWLPSLWAFALRFTAPAQWLALGTAAAAALLCALPLGGAPRAIAERGDDGPPARLLLCTVLPLLIVTAYLQYTHTLRPVDGALHVGQSTYGDLNLHLGIATSLRGAAFPPDYSLLPGVKLGYPFLADALSSSMLLLGTPLRWAFIVPGVWMCGLVYAGFVMLAWRLTRGRAATVLAFYLMFLNGGLGFAYSLDQVLRDPSRLRAVFDGFYLAPANLLDQNVRWSNVLVDLLIPQRTLLAGWAALIPALWLLLRAMERASRRDWLTLGVWAGALPMIHTHSFLALGLISAGAMANHLRARPRPALGGFLLYGGVAVALALPQLIAWSFPQTAGGGYPRLQFNWVNRADGPIDEYFWFWVKNVGPVFLLMVPAGRWARGSGRSLAMGALVAFAAAELVQFQPNAYDNNKVFYVAYLAMIPLVAGWLVELYRRMGGLPGRRLLAGVFVGVSVLSGALSVGREWVSDYQLYDPDEVAAAAFADRDTPRGAVFLTGTQHNNPISSLAGRSLVCGTSTFLYFHGLDYGQNAADAVRMYERPLQSADLFQQYGVDYIYLGDGERRWCDVDEAAIERTWPQV
ncbi:MAG: hypothetical protein GX558_06170, partial [Clostridiales bacterium]|nr:hypothetical protein [Clostridiales bacterium]